MESLVKEVCELGFGYIMLTLSLEHGSGNIQKVFDIGTTAQEKS